MGALVFMAVIGWNVFPFLFISGAVMMFYKLIKTKVPSGHFTQAGHHTPLSQISFDDIGGQEVAKRELKEALDFLKKEEAACKLGIRPLKGILLTGPPGTGKTLLAKAAAAYTQASFISASGSEFIEMYAGVGAQRIRKLFGQARQAAEKQNKTWAIIFIDEIEVLGGKRGQHTSHLEYDQTLNQLLVEMDGLKTQEGIRILLMGATNRVDLLDDALMRPGRFDRVIKVDLPDKEARLKILRIHTKDKPLDHDVILEQIAHDTYGFSGAHLESLVNEAAIFALRQRENQVKYDHFEEALEKVMMGEKLLRRPPEQEMERIAVHELGHAFVSEWIRPGSVSAVTVTSRGNALGYMRQTPEDDFYLHTQQYLEGQICISLAGSVAEKVILTSSSTGASNDFEQALRCVRRMIGSGMSSLGIVSLEDLPASLLHKATGEILQQQEKKVWNFIEENKDLIAIGVQKLLKNEKISGQSLREMLEQQNQVNKKVV